MPATSTRQAHTGRMAMAHKHGKPLADFPAGARAAIKSMAAMPESSLKDFMHTKKKKRKTLLSK